MSGHQPLYPLYPVLPRSSGQTASSANANPITLHSVATLTYVHLLWSDYGDMWRFRVYPTRPDSWMMMGAVLGAAGASTQPEHQGKFWWSATPFHGERQNGYEATLIEAKLKLEACVSPYVYARDAQVTAELVELSTMSAQL